MSFLLTQEESELPTALSSVPSFLWKSFRKDPDQGSDDRQKLIGFRSNP